MAQPGTTKIPVGTVLAGKYRVTREIGRGGMASVYEAENVDIGKRVAIKVLAQELVTSSVVVERFFREARAAAQIRSPYICDVYDSGRLEDSRPYLVLELLEGESLFERLSQFPHLNIDTTLTIMTQVCRGLTKAHAVDIVHRDLKPENIFLTKDEEGGLLSKILDFGLAKFYAPLTGPEGKAQARLTREGAVFGTPAYMSPEQVRGQGGVDHRADLWALGCITYECLTGKTVWKTEQGVAMTFAQIVGAPLPDAAETRPDLPPAFKGWFEKALARDLTRRFQTAKEFSEALVVALGTRSSMAEIDRSGRTPAPALASAARPPTPQDSAQTKAPATSATTGGAPAAPTGETGRPHSLASEPTQLQRSSFPGPVPADLAPAASSSTNATNALPPFASSSAMQRPPSPIQSSAAPMASTQPARPAQMNSPGPAALQAAQPANSGPLARQSGSGGAPSADVAATSRVPKRALIVAGVALLALTAGVLVGLRQFSHSGAPDKPTQPTSSASTTPSSSPTPTAKATTADPQARPAPPWVPLVRDAQQSLSTGDVKGAFKQLKDAFDKGGHGVPRTMLEHVQIGLATAAARSPCQLTGLARPRTYDIASPPGSKALFPGGRPSIAVSPKGPVIIWTDGHTGSDHAYTALLDSAMRGSGEPIDVTPDDTSVTRPELIATGERLLVSYWEQKGASPGVRVRALGADGSPKDASVLVGPSKARGATAALARADDSSLLSVWSNETELGSEDLFMRRLSPALEPQGEPSRATDFIPTGASKPRARFPSVTIQGDTINIAFRLERDPSRAVYYARVPIAEASKGLAAQEGPERLDRTMGQSTLINTDKSKAEAPSIACSSAACFIVWHAEMQGGVSGAYIEHDKAQPTWRKKFSKGARPTVSVSPSGSFQIAWFEAGRVMTASVTKDGVGSPSKLARVISDQPPPSLVAGSKPGEWYIAWLDYETGHLEPYAARAQCR